MPKKIFRRLLPKPSLLANRPGFKWLAPLLNDPDIFHINRKSISLSFFIGLFCAYLPIPGQMIVAALLAIWWRANLPFAVSLIWISNPFTIAPMFFLSYKVGAAMIGQQLDDFAIQLEWSWFAEQGGAILLPLILGSVVCGLVCGTAGFLAIRLLWRWQVINDWERRKRLRQEQCKQQDGRDQASG